MDEDKLKSVEEITKATRDITLRLADVFDKYFEKPLSEVGNIRSDWMKYYRYKNFLAILDRVDALHKKRRLEGKPIPIAPRIAIPLLEAAAVENDESLKELWARLIANGTDKTKAVKIHPSYIEIIKQLSPDEAKIIEAFSKEKSYPYIFEDAVTLDTNTTGNYRLQNRDTFYGIKELYGQLCSKLGLAYPENGISYLDNLMRLRLVEVDYYIDQELKSNSSLQYEPDVSIRLIQTRTEYLKITDFGDNFVEACIVPDN